MTKRKILVLAAGLLCVAALTTTALSVQTVPCDNDPGRASGNGITPECVGDNPTCADLLGSADFETEFKINDPVDGIYDISDTCQVEIDVRQTGQGTVFDWHVVPGGNCIINAIFVKGGPNGNLFDYAPDGATMDTGLHSPVNPNNRKYYGLSHISFCFSVRPPPECTPRFVDDDACGDPEAMFCAKSNLDAVCTSGLENDRCIVTLVDPLGGMYEFDRVQAGEEVCIDAIRAGCYTATVTDALGFVSENDCLACAIIDIGPQASCP